MSNGTNNPTLIKATAMPVAFCPHCGALVPTDARFCNACGESLTTAQAAAGSRTIHEATQPAVEPRRDEPQVVEELPDSPVGASRARRRISRKAGVAAGVAVVALVGGATALVLRPTPDHSPEQARASLRVTGSAVGRVVTQMHDVHDLHDLRAVGRAAQEQDAVLAAETARLRPIAQHDTGRRALAVVDAERDLVNATSLLLHLDAAHIGQWPATRERIEAAGLRLETTAPGVTGLGGAEARLVPSSAALGAALATDAHLVTHANAKLRHWRKAYNRARHAQHRRLAALGAYSGAVSAQLATYNGLRGDLDDWISTTGDDTIPYGQAYDQLTQAADRRKDVRDALAAIDPPQSLAAAHASLLAVLSDAIVAMTDAGDAAQTCTSDPLCLGDDFRDTPQWQSFTDASDRITSQFAAANQRWQQGVTSLRRIIRQRPMPVAPAV